MADQFPNDILTTKLETRAALDDGDRAAVQALSLAVRTIAPQTYMVREGDRPGRCAFLLSGVAARHKVTADGARQIVGFLIPGDFTDLQHLFLVEADHSVQSLTRLQVAEVARAELEELIFARPTIGKALWIEALVEASIARETVLNVGQREGPARLAHLMCEFDARLAAAGRADRDGEIPMTQEQMGDATGLTPVHVSRTLKQLEREVLVARGRRALRVVDWDGLQARADFNPRYLHLDRMRDADFRGGGEGLIVKSG